MAPVSQKPHNLWYPATSVSRHSGEELHFPSKSEMRTTVSVSFHRENSLDADVPEHHTNTHTSHYPQ